jgi:hypothetical protein
MWSSEFPDGMGAGDGPGEGLFGGDVVEQGAEGRSVPGGAFVDGFEYGG